jgi:maleylacetate reductase
LRWNAPVNEHRQRELAHILGGEEAGPAIEAFVRGLGLPTRLSEQGIAASEIPGLAARWTGDAPIATNPRPCARRGGSRSHSASGGVMAGLYRCTMA